MKRIFLFKALIILAASANAQLVSIGIRAGGNVASASQSSIDQIRSLIQTPGNNTRLEAIAGYHAGVVIRIGGPNFSVQPEILYSQYGARIISGDNLAQLTSNVMEVPLLVKYTFTKRAARLFVNAGPFVDYALNGKYKVNAQVGSIPLNITQDLAFDKTVDRIAYGLTGGAGVTWRIGPGSLLAEARVSYSLKSKIPPSVLVLGGTELHARLGMLSIGYLFSL